MELHVHPSYAFMTHTGITLHLTLLLFSLTCGPILRYKSTSISNFSPVSFHYPSSVYLNNRVFKTGSVSAEDNRSAPFRSLHICDDVRYVPVNKCCTATSRTEKKVVIQQIRPVLCVSFPLVGPNIAYDGSMVGPSIAYVGPMVGPSIAYDGTTQNDTFLCKNHTLRLKFSSILATV
jgi:hypothetical protein